ncbi:MAG TPA: thiamine-phosphate kinase [bacterium]|nr:thiamine-phosphate kinase [bacterium]HPN31825.1 thiamine-phosphate kinase [bacterium]
MNELSIIKYISKLKSAEIIALDKKINQLKNSSLSCGLTKRNKFGIGDADSTKQIKTGIGIGIGIGIGDDCAIIPYSSSHSFLITTDSLIENVHFNLKWTSLYLLGCKSVLVNISDILSCGGVPENLFLSINIPKRLKNIRRLFDGIDFICQKYGIKILGGDTTSSKNDLCITITLLGKVNNKNILYRHTSKSGDLICITGYAGLSGTGFNVLKKKIKGYPESIRQHLIPEILSLKDAAIISKFADSCMDNSDGLYSSIRTMLDNTKRGCMIDFSKIPVHPETVKYCTQFKIDLEEIINFGEDYNCVFTASKVNIKKIKNLLKAKLSIIGEITSSGKKYILKNKKKIKLIKKGFIHND